MCRWRIFLHLQTSQHEKQPTWFVCHCVVQCSTVLYYTKWKWCVCSLASGFEHFAAVCATISISREPSNINQSYCFIKNIFRIHSTCVRVCVWQTDKSRAKTMKPYNLYEILWELLKSQADDSHCASLLAICNDRRCVICMCLFPLNVQSIFPIFAVPACTGIHTTDLRFASSYAKCI